MSAEFVHLHNHTEYSLLDGACRLTDDKGNPSELFNLISKEHKMSALAITDHGNMYGAMEFYWAAKESGIKPIIGCEVYVAPRSRKDKEKLASDDDGRYYNHLTLLATNYQGYQNLMRISSIGYLEGFYYKPRIDTEILNKYHEGIICLSGCILGKVANCLLRGKDEEAFKTANEYQDIFGKGNYYIEIMDHNLADQKQIIPGLTNLSKKTGIPIVATNDCHFLRKEDHEAHDVLLCIGTNRKLSEENRMHYSEFCYYRSAQEMTDLFSYIPEAVKNTLAIAEKINIEIKSDQILLPAFPIPQGFISDSQYLEKLCTEGLSKRYTTITKDHTDRLKHELSVINKMGFASYFLIVEDFIRYAKNNNIPVGPGRGSGAGSMVAYTLGITDICPLKYGLLFERFLNPDRRSMPDLDIDFADRDTVIEYVIKKYGSEKCAQIITFGSMQARQAIKDVARTMDFTPTESNDLAKLIPFGSSIDEALAENNDLTKKIASDEKIAKLINFSKKLEGLKRHTGVHAAGMVIANEDILNYSPLQKGSKDIITTQYDGVVLPRLGLLKVDFLGLRTLTIIDDCIKLIRKEKDKNFDIENIPLDDLKTYELLSQAKSMGIFQLESDGMRELMGKLKPESIEDIIALVALYRPGPMGSGMLDDFVNRKHGRKKIKYDHPLQEPILKETYGVILYQEQAMRMSMDLADFTPGQADGLRKAMSKKTPEVMAAQREKFVSGAQKKGISKAIADKIYTNIEAFGGYGFNKSHSAAYAVVSYRTAYLKANFTLEYLTSMLNSQIGRSAIRDNEESQLVKYLADAQDFGIEILPPDVRYSDGRFSIEGNNIRFGLLAIKSVGEGVVESIEQARVSGGEFKDWNDFLQRIDLKSANKLAFEGLTKSGAFDCFGKDKLFVRSSILKNMENYLSTAAKIKEEKASSQGMLFDDSKDMGNIVLLANEKPFEQKEALDLEKDVLGFYLSGHPLADKKKELEMFSDYRFDKLPVPESEKPSRNEEVIRLAGMITSVKKSITKLKKEEMAKIKIEDLYASIEAIVFPQKYLQYRNYLVENSIVVVKGRLAGTEEKKELFVEEIIPFEQARHTLIAANPCIHIKISTQKYDDDLEIKLKELLEKHQGKAKVFLDLEDPKNGNFLIETSYMSDPSEDFIAEVVKEIGSSDAVRIERVR
ncbi:MAG: DNA polymerase III subunit alpha [Elusimicrobiota bacterium]|jgi:DNA polymerase-3 subunit alpha|nr:DNA polymerase III subunit alpha [Elusimicrobiota bacterium]